MKDIPIETLKRSGTSVALLRSGETAASLELSHEGPIRSSEQKVEVITMGRDRRDVLELFREELDFIEKGGYGRSVRTPWKPTSTFQDSLTCINFGQKLGTHPCDECRLIDYVPTEKRGEAIPCHHIPLTESGETVETLELKENQQKMENTVKQWLASRITQLEAAGTLQH
jgi:hypothetical protein